MIGRKIPSPVPALVCAVLTLGVVACNPDRATTGPSGVSGKDFAANLRMVSGDQQVGPIAQTLTQPIKVKVVDAGGQPVQGATVTFSVRAGGGSLNPVANVSGADGIVTTTWTLGSTLGANKAVAVLTGAFVLDSAVFNATATVGAPQRFSKVSGDSQTINASRRLAAPLVVKVQDSFGNNLSGVRVLWAVGNFSGTVIGVVDTTAADGTAAANWTLGNTATYQSVTATVAGLTAIPFTALATPDTGRVLTITGGLNQTATAGAALPLPLAVRVTDQYGNIVTGAGITWNDSITSGGRLSANVGTTSALGASSVAWTLGRIAGQQLVRAKLAGRTETATWTANANVSLSDVNAGNFSVCGLATDGTAMCWGYGADGQLGKLANQNNTGSLTTSVSPTDTLAGPFLTFRSLNVGKNHTCGVTIGRDVYCWGSNNVLQLGAGAAGGTPAKWKGDLAWVSVSAGEFNTCALTPVGALYCSGLNDQGQMGGNAASTTPSPVVQVVSAVSPDTLFSTVAVGQSHICAMPRAPAAIVPRCWGFNTSGQVGDGSGPATTRRLVPTQISTGGVLPTAYDSTTLVSGNAHSCAVATAPAAVVGATYCWGGNGFGQLGNGNTTNQASPVLVQGGFTFVQLSAGAFHTCGLTGSGNAYCWGRNNLGQLGDGTQANSAVPVAVSNGVPFRTISAGELFTCAVAGQPAPSGGTAATAADVYCWGDNEYGQVGNTTVPRSNAAPRMTPIKISFIP
jgi:alpha-tubulin suppressor-like RCC1 family protein